MNSTLDSSIDSCNSHISMYYEQKQEEKVTQHQVIECDSCKSIQKIWPSPPVEIHEENTTSIDLPPMTWHGYHVHPRVLSVTNTGRTILINAHWANSRPYVEGGPLNGNYIFSQIHFHCPSEHEIDGRRYPLEMHVVHYKTSYLTQERAMDEKDGTVVLVYLFKLMKTCETVVSQITKLAPHLEKLNSRTETTEIALDQLIKPFTSNYYVYWGSVRTKKKSYLLQWIISCCHLGVTEKEVEDLSSIITCAGLSNEKRTIQMKPDNDAVFHVGEADYSLPPLRTCSTGDICTICKYHEGESCALVCNCQPKPFTCSSHCKTQNGDCFCCNVTAAHKILRERGIEDKCPLEICSQQYDKRKSKKEKKLKVTGELQTNGGLTYSCESGNESSQSHVSEDKKKKKRKKNKKKKQIEDCDLQIVSDGEDEKCSSKSSAHVEKRKKFGKNSEKSSQSASESECKKSNKKKKKNTTGSQKPNNRSDIENEGCDGEKSKKKKKKKKQEIYCIESMHSVSGSSKKTGSDLCGLQLNSSGLLLFSSKSSASEDETNVKTCIMRSECPETEVIQDSTLVEKSGSVRDNKKTKEVKGIEVVTAKSATVSGSSKSRSRSPANLKKLKDQGSSEPKVTSDSNSKYAKSKSLVNDILLKKKVSVKKEKDSCEPANLKSKTSLLKDKKSKERKTKRAPESSEPQSVEKSKRAMTKTTTESLKSRRGSKSPADTKTSKSTLTAKKTSKPVVTNGSKEKAKRDNKSKSSGHGDKKVPNNEITTLFEKKPGGKKDESVGGDVQINFLLTPSFNCISNPSCGLTTSESDFTEEKKICENADKKKELCVQDVTINTVTTPASELPGKETKEESQVYLLMKHIFHTENREGQAYKCRSQEYHVAIMCDENIIQEYKGKFHPQELCLGSFDALKLIPSHPEFENSSFQLQDCCVKKESSDQICIKMKISLKEPNITKILASMKNRVDESEKKKTPSLIDKETQFSCNELYIAGKSNWKSSGETLNNEKEMKFRQIETSSKESKLKPEEAQNKQSENSFSQGGKEIMDSQKCTIRLQKNPIIDSEDIPEIFNPGEGSADSKGGKDKSEKGHSDKTYKKTRPLYIRRRKTVYFMYDKVEKDEASGKKIFVGSFRTQEEVDFLKKQKKSLQKNESFLASEKTEKSKETSETKFLLSLGSKDADLEILNSQDSARLKERSSFDKDTPSTSQDVPNNKKKDIVTLHKYRPKYSGINFYKEECKNMLIGKVMSNLHKDSENFKNLAEIIGVEKEKEPKISIYELQEASEMETEKENPDFKSSKSENKNQRKNKPEDKARTVSSKTEVTENFNKTNEVAPMSKPQKSFDSKESQAALILIPVEVESLSKIEVILIEHLDDIKKNKKKNEYIPCLKYNK